jgi:predicted Fe-Mo cluster-binding NifX family protein
MRIAVTSGNDQGLNSPFYQHFGHSPFFTIVDVEDGQVKKVDVVSNPHSVQHTPGAVPAFIKEQNADVILTGGMGARAVQFFNQMGIEPLTCSGSIVSEVIDQFINGSASGVVGCSHDHDDHHSH